MTVMVRGPWLGLPWLDRAWATALVCLFLAGCGVNEVPRLEEQAKAAWAQVQNQYQRRADLVPNLVETVKGYASHERETLEAVTNARSRATGVTLSPELLNDPQAVQRFEAAQGELSQALGRLLAISENYPDLKANQNFLALQSQLEGTENRIAVARRDYVEAVRAYNTELRTIPGRWIAALVYPEAEPMVPFTATPEAQQAPTVRF